MSAFAKPNAFGSSNPICPTLLRYTLGAGRVDNAVSMLRWGIESIELKGSTAGIDDVVIRSSRDVHGEARADLRMNAIQNGLARAFLNAKELIKLVHFHPDLFLRFQCHAHELTVLRCIKHLAKIFILDRNILYVLYKAFHNTSSR